MATGRRKSSRTKKEETNWQEKVIQIRRVSKVVKGGKKLSFRAIVVVGNEKGQVGSHSRFVGRTRIKYSRRRINN